MSTQPATDLEARPPATESPKEQPKRKKLFLLFGGISITWCVVLVWVMQTLALSEHRLEDGYDFKGGDIDSLHGVKTASACSRACEQHPRCLAFTYVKSEDVCWLKGEGYIAKSNPNTVSGAINATLAAKRQAQRNNESRRDEENVGTDDPYEDEGEAYHKGSDDAYSLGHGERHGVFRGGGYRGYRNDNDAWGAEEEGDGYGAITSDDEVQRFDDATTFFGDVSIQTEIRSASECEALCSSHGQCAAWTLDKYKRLCLLRLLNASGVRYAADFISGRLDGEQISRRAAGLRQEAADEAARRDEMRAAAAARNASRVAARANGTAARGGRNASGFEGDGGEEGESIYSAFGDEDGGDYEFLDGLPSRPRPIYDGGSWPLPAEYRGTLEGVDLRGGDLRDVVEIDTVAGCIEACHIEPNCTGWTLRKASGVCYVKRAGFARTAVNKSEGLISGTL